MGTNGDIRNVGFIIIGNEVLSGKVRDANTPFLIDSFTQAGIRVGEVAMVADDVPRLAEVIRGFSARFDLVITTGGVGPTHDDCTWQAVAKAIDAPLELHHDMLARMEARSAVKLTEEQRRMAFLPRGTVVDMDAVRWPILQVKNIIVMPGPPSMVHPRVERLCAKLARPRPWLATAYFTADEWQSITHIDAVVGSFPDLEIGSYPVFTPNDHKLRLTFEGPDEERVKAAVAQVTEALGPDTLVRVTWRPPVDSPVDPA